MEINNKIITSYSQCKHKAYLLLNNNSNSSIHRLTQYYNKQKDISQEKHFQLFKEAQSNISINKEAVNKHNIILDSTVEYKNLKAHCPSINNYNGKNIVTIFSGTNTITTVLKIELLFIIYVLRKKNIDVNAGYIITSEFKKHALKIYDYSKITRLLDRINAMSEKPMLILNKSCELCEFKQYCLGLAKEDDNLSLLSNISTENQIEKYRKKGIFTTEQLSYTYKPRRVKKKAKNKNNLHRNNLQALALRTNKIYIEVLPNKEQQQNIELFVDIEGIPEKNLYFLFGLIVKDNQKLTKYSYWINDKNEEKKQWLIFINKLNSFPKTRIYHYGNYENKVFKVLSKRYHTDVTSIIERLINVNQWIFGKIYFPTYSNGLKDIGKYIGATWEKHDSSGLMAIYWRYCWEETFDNDFKTRLINYNIEDCSALLLLVKTIFNIKKRDDVVKNILDEIRTERCPPKNIPKINQELSNILTFSYTTEHYNSSKISFKNGERCVVKNEANKKPTQKRVDKFRPTKEIKIRRRVKCPKCGLMPLTKSKNTTEKISVDLKFTQNTIVKEVRKYWAYKSYCKQCKKAFNPAYFNIHGHPGIYGRNIKIWVCYLRIVLRNPYSLIRKITLDLFKIDLSDSRILSFIDEVGKYYIRTEKILIKNLLKGEFIHIDETTINIKGENQYVWVLRNNDSVYLKLTETRESDFIKDFLKNYTGTIITDFYSGYDSVDCLQQKCWVHLIRDINNDLWQYPSDYEFHSFVKSLKELLYPIMESIQRFGLKAYHLKKHKKSVEKYLNSFILKVDYNSSRCIKYQKRVKKYRKELFTFLDHNDILWHNNPAEIVVKHLKLQGDISKSYSKATTIHYLRLLSIMQTCRFQKKIFLRFLLSGKLSINDFKNSDAFLRNKRAYNCKFDINLHR